MVRTSSTGRDNCRVRTAVSVGVGVGLKLLNGWYNASRWTLGRLLSAQRHLITSVGMRQSLIPPCDGKGQSRYAFSNSAMRFPMVAHRKSADRVSPCTAATTRLSHLAPLGPSTMSQTRSTLPGRQCGCTWDESSLQKSPLFVRCAQPRGRCGCAVPLRLVDLGRRNVRADALVATS